MARRRLHNDDWGLETNCFVCEASNSDGLRLEIFSDDEAGAVDAGFTLGAAHSGAPTLVHGGLLLAILDEVQAWAVIALEHSWALTSSTSARFLQPVRIDATHRAVGRITARDGDRVTTEGWIEDDRGERCVESQASFVVVGEALARTIADAEIPADHRRYLSDSD